MNQFLLRSEQQPALGSPLHRALDRTKHSSRASRRGRSRSRTAGIDRRGRGDWEDDVGPRAHRRRCRRGHLRPDRTLLRPEYDAAVRPLARPRRPLCPNRYLPPLPAALVGNGIEEIRSQAELFARGACVSRRHRDGTPDPPGVGRPPLVRFQQPRAAAPPGSPRANPAASAAGDLSQRRADRAKSVLPAIARVDPGCRRTSTRPAPVVCR